MAETVLKLADARKPDPDVIERIRQVLAAAESGTIVGVAFATENVGGEAGTGYAISPDGCMTVLIGAIEILKFDIITGRK